MDPKTVEFYAALMAIQFPKNPKFIQSFKELHGEQYRPVTILLYLTSFTYNLGDIFMYPPLERDTVLNEEFCNWVGELTVPEPDHPIVPIPGNRKRLLLPTETGWKDVQINQSCTDMTLRMSCPINPQGYPILPTRSMGKKELRTKGGNGRLIHPLKGAVVVRFTCP